MSNYLGVSYLVPVDPSMRLVPARPLRQQSAPLLYKKKKKCRQLQYYEVVELIAWIVLLVHNFVLYISMLEKDKLIFPILFVFILSLFQPTFYLVSVLTRHKILNSCLAAVLLIVSLYLGTSYEHQSKHHKHFQRWIQVSSYLIAGFALWSFLKHLVANLNNNHQIFAIVAAVFLCLLTYSISFVHHAHFKSMEYAQLVLAFSSFFFLLLCGCQFWGSKFLRFLLRLMLICGQILIVYADYFERQGSLEVVQVYLSRVFSLVNMILTLRALWKIEEELKEEGQRFYNRRIAHDRFTQ